MNKRLARCTVAIALAVSACGASGDSESAGSADVAVESISVAGDWTIDVLNPDGTVAEHVEFRNEFVGATILSKVLAGTNPVDFWTISVDGDAGVDLCPSSSTAVGTDVFCEIAATAKSEAAPFEAGQLVLSGTFVPEADGSVGRVDGRVKAVGDTVAQFSTKNLTDAGGPGVVPVLTGQTVLIEVRYSFG